MRSGSGCAPSSSSASPDPSAGIVDSQSVKGADTLSKATRGYDAGKKINGRGRHIVTDTMGLLAVVMVRAGSVQDRDGGRQILKSLAPGALLGAPHLRRRRLLEASPSRSPRAPGASPPRSSKGRPGKVGFAVLPRHWVVERTFSWLLRWRRLARDYERLPETHEAMGRWSG